MSSRPTRRLCGADMTQTTDAIAIAKIIGRTPNDLSEGEGCDEKCETDGGTCICAELYRPAADKIIKYLNRNR